MQGRPLPAAFTAVAREGETARTSQKIPAHRGHGRMCGPRGVVLPGRILQLVDDSLIIVARVAQLLDVFLGDVLLALPDSLSQAKVRGLRVRQLSFAP